MDKFLHILLALSFFALIYVLAEKKYYFDYLNDQKGCHVSNKISYEIQVESVESTKFLETVPGIHVANLLIKTSNLKKLHVPHGVRGLELKNVNCDYLDSNDLQNLHYLFIDSGNVNLEPISSLKDLKALMIIGRNYKDLPDLSNLQSLELLILDFRIHKDERELLELILPNCSVSFSNYYTD